MNGFASAVRSEMQFSVSGSKMPTSKNREWTAEELDELRRMADGGASSLRISARLRRTQGAVKARAREMGIRLVEVERWHAKRSASALAKSETA